MTEISERYDRLGRQFSATVADLDEAGWTAASPCDGWTVKDVVSHVVDTQRDFLGRFPDVVGSLPDATDDLAADLSALHGRAVEVLRDDRGEHTYDGYFGPTTIAESLDGFYAMDLLVHRWDVARGAGLSEHEALDDPDASYYLSVMQQAGDAVRQDGICGPEVPVPEDATPGEKLLGFTGRDPRA